MDSVSRGGGSCRDGPLLGHRKGGRAFGLLDRAGRVDRSLGRRIGPAVDRLGRLMDAGGIVIFWASVAGLVAVLAFGIGRMVAR